MLIKDIPYPKVRALAEERAGHANGKLGEGFIWVDTPEGYKFWNLVEQGKYDQAAEILPHLFEEGDAHKQMDLFDDMDTTRTYSYKLVGNSAISFIELPATLKIGDEVKLGPDSYVVQCRYPIE